MELVRSGIESLGDIAWGSHFCQFYHGPEELLDTLVPYFKAGLENHESCLWITSEHLKAHEARTILAAAVPGLEAYEEKGQIEIINHSDWYLRSGNTDADATLQMWVDRQQRALEDGYHGLRLTGDTAWLGKNDWNDFVAYEAKVHATFSKHRIVGLCSYCLERASANEVFDVVRNHDFALLRNESNWELLESVSSRSLKRNVEQLNHQLKANLRKAKKQAEEASQQKTDFLANMSHEIRTPLGAILGFTSLLKESDVTEEDRKSFLDAVERNGQSLSRLLDDFLDVAKIETNMLEMEKTSFSIHDLVNDVISTFEPKARMKSLVMQSFIDPTLPAMIESDPNRLRQVLMNLVGNSLKFTAAGSIRLHVSAVQGQPPSRVVFRVQDTGIGMDALAKDTLFQPFKQAEASTSRRFGGTGLGLYLSQRLAGLLGGEVVLEHSEPGVGSTFAVTIAVGPMTLQNPPEVPLPTIEKRKLQDFRILVAEDNPDNRLLIGYILKNTGGFIRFVQDGEEVLGAVEQEDFDIVLMDLQMPRVDGYEALNRLRSKGFQKPVVALSAHALASDRKNSIHLGFNAHLTKPINRDELLQTLMHYKVNKIPHMVTSNSRT